MREIDKRKRWIEMLVMRTDTGVQRRIELICRPVTDAGLLVRRYVRRIHSAEGGHERKAASVGWRAGHWSGVTAGTIAQYGEIFAAHHRSLRSHGCDNGSNQCGGQKDALEHGADYNSARSNAPELPLFRSASLPEAENIDTLVQAALQQDGHDLRCNHAIDCAIGAKTQNRETIRLSEPRATLWRGSPIKSTFQ